MDDHIIDPEQAAALRDPSRYRLCSREELLGAVEHGTTVVEIGSGTGFFTDAIAMVAETVHAVDMQAEMHAQYRDHGVPENVQLHHTDAAAITDLSADVIVSLFTVHELELDATLPTLASILNPGGHIFVVDWSAASATDNGPPKEHLQTAADAAARFGAYFDVEAATERYETFRLRATN